MNKRVPFCHLELARDPVAFETIGIPHFARNDMQPFRYSKVRRIFYYEEYLERIILSANEKVCRDSFVYGCAATQAQTMQG